MDQRERYFRQLQDSLKPGGRCAIIDFTMDSLNEPPKSARIAPEQVKVKIARVGYTRVEERGFLPNQ